MNSELELVPPIILVSAEDNMCDDVRKSIEAYHDGYILLQFTRSEARSILHSDFELELVNKLLSLPASQAQQVLKLAVLHHYGGILVDGSGLLQKRLDKLRTYTVYLARTSTMQVSPLLLTGMTRSLFWKEVLLTYVDFQSTVSEVLPRHDSTKVQTTSDINVIPTVVLSTRYNQNAKQK